MKYLKMYENNNLDSIKRKFREFIVPSTQFKSQGNYIRQSRRGGEDVEGYKDGYYFHISLYDLRHLKEDRSVYHYNHARKIISESEFEHDYIIINFFGDSEDIFGEDNRDTNFYVFDQSINNFRIATQGEVDTIQSILSETDGDIKDYRVDRVTFDDYEKVMDKTLKAMRGINIKPIKTFENFKTEDLYTEIK